MCAADSDAKHWKAVSDADDAWSDVTYITDLYTLLSATGVPNSMPALNENLTVRERWDVVNYLRTFGSQ